MPSPQSGKGLVILRYFLEINFTFLRSVLKRRKPCYLWGELTHSETKSSRAVQTLKGKTLPSSTSSNRAVQPSAVFSIAAEIYKMKLTTASEKQAQLHGCWKLKPPHGYPRV